MAAKHAAAMALLQLLAVASWASAAGASTAATGASAADFPADTPTTVPSLPSSLTWEKMWVFAVLPGKQAPTPPGPYVDAGYGDLNYKGAAPVGFLMAVRYNEASPLKAYDEVIYIAGQYQPACLPKPLYSETRIWVSDRGTQKAGRCIWGLTKELANFQWAEGPNWRSFKMIDPTGKTTFMANITDDPLLTKVTPLAVPLIPTTYPVVQWPVNGVPGSPCQADDPAYAATIDALSTNPPGLLTWDLTLSWAEPVVAAKVVNSYVDPAAFTGRNEPVHLVPVALRLVNGAGLLTKPKVVRC